MIMEDYGWQSKAIIFIIMFTEEGKSYHIPSSSSWEKKSEEEEDKLLQTEDGTIVAGGRQHLYDREEEYVFCTTTKQ